MGSLQVAEREECISVSLLIQVIVIVGDFFRQDRNITDLMI